MAQNYTDKVLKNIKTTWLTTNASINSTRKSGGYGIIAVDKNKNVIYENKQEIDTEDAQYGEIVGIKNVLDIIINKKIIINEKEIAIVCDCKNAIKIITNIINCPNNYKKIIQNINQKIYIINNNLNIKINFHWIPGHINNEFNDRVDTLAKEAANGVNGHNPPFFEQPKRCSSLSLSLSQCKLPSYLQRKLSPIGPSQLGLS